MDKQWHPSWPAAIISWADFGLPVDSEEAVVLAGVAPADAVPWVRRTYDARAVETADQEEWVPWFSEWAARRSAEPH